jgi:hypothetical protein
VVADAEIREAVSTLAKDSNLGPPRKIRTLRWKGWTSPPDTPRPGILRWLLDAVAWFAGMSRWIFWLVVVAVVGLIAVLALRALRPGPRPVRGISEPAPNLPTHVGHWDIRPESLPTDIGSAARDYWDRGEQRAALSLLYRGMLSRLVHRHGVPIRVSSTEAECVALATQLAAPRQHYVTTLIDSWERAVYRGQWPATPELRALCAQFGAALETESQTAVRAAL